MSFVRTAGLTSRSFLQVGGMARKPVGAAKVLDLTRWTTLSRHMLSSAYDRIRKASCMSFHLDVVSATA